MFSFRWIGNQVGAWNAPQSHKLEVDLDERVANELRVARREVVVMKGELKRNQIEDCRECFVEVSRYMFSDSQVTNKHVQLL